MGVIAPGMVVTTSDGRARKKKIQPGGREWATVIQGVNARGWAVPPFIVLKGANLLKSWFAGNAFLSGWRPGVSDNGWTTNDLGLEWIKHFDLHTKDRSVGAYRLLVLDGHESHHSVPFELYCKEHNIITLCMPAHSSHLLQPLDVGCFGPLKQAYSRQIDDLLKARLTHVAKEDFLSAFIKAFPLAMTPDNVQGGFRGAGLVPFNPDQVLQELDIILKTPTPPGTRPGTALPWAPQTPNNPTEAQSQSDYIRNRIASHQDSSPTSMYEALNQMLKYTTKVAHHCTLQAKELSEVRKANEALSRRRTVQKTRL